MKQKLLYGASPRVRKGYKRVDFEGQKSSRLEIENGNCEEKERRKSKETKKGTRIRVAAQESSRKETPGFEKQRINLITM